MPPEDHEWQRLGRSLRAAQTRARNSATCERHYGAMAKRSYGTGSLFEKGGSWYGQWRVGGRLVKRKLGARREVGTRQGLTKAQAERELRRTMDEVRSVSTAERVRLEGATYAIWKRSEPASARRFRTTRSCCAAISSRSLAMAHSTA